MTNDEKPASFIGRFMVLRGAARELWLTFALKFLGVAAYALTVSMIRPWLNTDMGFTDLETGTVFFVWSLCITIFTLLVGSLTDAIGLRRTFFLGMWICVGARLVMAFSTNGWLAIAFGLAPLAIGEALSSPVFVAATHKYSNTRQRSIAFSLVYVAMNVGFLVAGFFSDHVRALLGEAGQVRFLGLGISTYRLIFLGGVVCQLAMWPLLLFVRKGVAAGESGVTIVPEINKYAGRKLLDSFRLTVRDAVKDTVQLFGGLLHQAGFYRLLAFLLFIAFIKLIQVQMNVVFPTFGIRELGEGAPVGRLWAINSIVVILIVPFIGALTQRFPAYRMVILGGLLSSLSVFVMALPTPWFEGMADGWLGSWIGHGYLGLKGSIHPYYVMIAIYVVVLSVGEALYSPRVYEYSAAIAPKGQEASYSALSYMPMLLAKLLGGMALVAIQAKYCPASGERDSGTMWLILGFITLVAPIGLICLKRFIRVKEEGREE